MTKSLSHIAILLIVLHSYHAFSQVEQSAVEIITQRIEYISQQYNATNIDYSNLTEILTYYYNHPLNLNTATDDELGALNLMTSFQVSTLVRYRIQHGDLLTIYELRNLPGFDQHTLQIISAFIAVSPPVQPISFQLKQAVKFGHIELFSLWGRTLENQEGYPNTYLGDPNRFWIKGRYRHKNLFSVGFTAEKDPGEMMFPINESKGMDFYSAHIFVRNIGKVKQLALGDYHAQFGQGLTFWSGFSYRKTSDALNVIKYPRKLSPYSSRNENNFLRGAGTSIEWNKLALTAFYSQKKIDANLSIKDSNVLTPSFSQIQESGLHRTINERGNKKSISEQIIGTHLNWKGQNFNIGATVIHSKYDANLNPATTLYQKFLLDTNEWYNTGIDAKWLLKKAHLFGEISRSSNGAIAYLGGGLFQLDSRFNLSVVTRNYSANYLSTYTNAFGERAQNNNEKGIYIGINSQLSSQINISAYWDYYKFDWLSYQVDGPSIGHDYMFRIQWQLTPQTNFYVRYRKESNLRNSKDDVNIRSLHPQDRTWLRFHLHHNPQPNFILNSRIEFSQAQFMDKGKGFLIFQEFQYTLKNQATRIIGRLTIFDVDDYQARIYTYENDVLYYFSVSAYYQKGTRAYLVLHHKINSKFEFWTKVSRTFLYHETTIGTGNDRISKPHKTEIRLQVRFKF